MLSVIVATYQRYSILGDCLEALQNQTLGSRRFEILVIDNSPDEEASLAFAQRFSNIKNIRWIYQSTPGLSAARNRGIRESRYPLMAFIDDDALAVPTWGEQIIDAFDSYGERVVAVGGRIDLGWRTPRPDWLHPSMCKFLTTIDYGPDRRLLNRSEQIAGANMAFRRSVFDKCGMFSEGLGRKGRATLLSNEEIQLQDAIHDGGDHIAYAPGARVEHVVDPDRLVQSWFRKRIAWQAVSDLLDNPGVVLNDLDQHWRWLGEYFLTVTPSDRNLRGLLVDCADGEALSHQINAIYNALACLLGSYSPESR